MARGTEARLQAGARRARAEKAPSVPRPPARLAKNPLVQVHGLEKGLAILQSLSALGEASAAELATAVGLPRPTAHRMLHTLIALGYVKRGGSRGTFRLTAMVHMLAKGYRADDWVTDVAEPIMAQYYHSILWPTDLATYDDGEMLIRTTTHHLSPMSLHRNVVGMRLPMLKTAVGTVYLAFCTPEERRAILLQIERPEAGQRRSNSPARFVTSQLEMTRQRGFGIRANVRGARTSSIAVPIILRSRVVGCLTVIWISSALSLDHAIEKFLPIMQEMAWKIELGCAGRSDI